jgi:hypothetical protein
MSQTSTMKSPSPGATSALAALHRAAVDARKIAMQTNTGIIVRRDGKLLEISAAELIAEASPKIAAE